MGVRRPVSRQSSLPGADQICDPVAATSAAEDSECVVLESLFLWLVYLLRVATPLWLHNIERHKSLSVVMFVGSITVFECVWSPERASFDYYKLASIMYLYDKTACGYRLQDKSVKNLQLSNNTKGLNVLPIKCEPAIVTVSTRLSARTRTYIKLSMVLHIAWMIIAIALKIMIKKNTLPRFLKYILTATFYSCISITFFDLSMAIVYVAHIRQSLTKGMIVRYSGWSVLLKLENANDFAGWLPMIATACWMRGVFILALNIYNCRIINHIRKKLQKREFRERCAREANLPIPEPRRHTMRTNILYYRPGELKPYYVNDSRFY